MIQAVVHLRPATSPSVLAGGSGIDRSRQASARDTSVVGVPHFDTLESFVESLQADGRTSGRVDPEVDQGRRTAAVISDVLGIEARVPCDCRIERLADAVAALQAGTATWRQTASQRALTDGRIAGLYVYASR
jgi:hypothetical protein